ncbi:MAG: glycosyltransferase family 4 protein [Anaerolineaceae bacterium]|nr:glycosyltransferase family 4 protein [Anaerolineaceae bacterium]
MRIGVHDYAGHPFQVQLSRELARRGHTVTHYYCGHNNTPKGDLLKSADDPACFFIQPIHTRKKLQKYSLFNRWMQEIEYGHLLAKELEKAGVEVVLSANTPLDSQNIILSDCKKNHMPYIFWVQDLNGQAAYKILSRKFPVLGHLIGRYHIYLERKLLKGSDALVLISEDFPAKIRPWAREDAKIWVIQNWAPISDYSVKPKENAWAKRHHIADRFCFLYTGTLGMKHTPGLISALAQHYKESSPEVCVLVISEGPGAEWLLKIKSDLNLSNLEILPYQPYEEMPEVLASGDVLVTILNSDAGDFSVPSKVLTNLCAARPQLLAVSSNNLAARIIQEQCAGLVTPPDDETAFLQAADFLYENRDERLLFGNNGRLYAQENFNIQQIASKFEQVIIYSTQAKG